MIQEQMADHQGLLNQIRLDLLLRRLGTTVLRQKFKEVYAKLNGGQEWTDGPESGQKFCHSQWGSPAYDKANSKQQEVIRGGDIQSWDLSCLQSVITQMLTVALKDRQEEKNSSVRRKGEKEGNDDSLRNKGQSLQPVSWDPSWWGQMSKIRQLANIRNDISHMPTEALTQGEFDEKWDNAVEALRALGAKRKEINEIRQITQSTFSSSGQGHQGQCQMSNQNGQAQPVIEGKIREEEEKVEELPAKNEEFQLQTENHNQVKNLDKTKIKDQSDEVKSPLTNKNVNPLMVNRKNEFQANSLMGKGDLAGRFRDWNKALAYYTQALEIPDISDDQRVKIYINRSCVHLGVLRMPEYLSNVNRSDSETKSREKFPAQSKLWKDYNFLDEKLLEMNYQKWPETVKEELKEFHLTAGMADAQSALELSPDHKSTKPFYHLAQFHQLKGDWPTALTFFDQAVSQSDLDDYQLEFDRNVCQLHLLNQEEVEEFIWILGKREQTMAGLAILRNPHKWRKVLAGAMRDPGQEQLYGQMIRAHFLAQGVSNQKTEEVIQRPVDFEKVVKLYEGPGTAGVPSAIYNLGLLFQEGNGVQRNFLHALLLFKKAAKFQIDDRTPEWAKEGVLEAQYRLGLCYEFGLGVGKDEKKALHWFEMASLGNYGKASRKLADIYSQGLLGVSKDEDMALFCRNQAATHGDIMALTSGALQLLKSPPVAWETFSHSLHDFSRAIALSCEDSTPFMLAAIFSRKKNYEPVLANVLQEQSQSNSVPEEVKTGEREPKEVSWNVPTLINHTLHTIHLLELAQRLEFQQKLKNIPNWRKQFNFTDRLVDAADFCVEGLTAFRELNQLYLEFLIDGKEQELEIDYPPDLRKISGVDPAALARESQLVTVILTSFASSLRLVGAVNYHDQPTQSLIQRLLVKLGLMQNSGPKTLEEYKNFFNVDLLYSYSHVFELAEEERSLKRLEGSSWKKGDPFSDNWPAISGAAVQGSLEKFEEAASKMKAALRELRDVDPWFSRTVIKSTWDSLFVQALCVKSAAVIRGVNSANRKKINEGMEIFRKFLEICPKDEPRRAEAHYQLGLCTLYLEKKMVNGQVKRCAKDILAKVRLHFTEGEGAEQDLPWKEFQLPQKSPVKTLLQQKIGELEALIFNKTPTQNLTPNLEGESTKSESSCFGRLLDPYYKFPISAFPLKLRGQRRVEVITRFRSFFKAAHSGKVKFVCTSVGSPPSSIFDGKLSDLLRLPESPYSVTHVITDSMFVGCYAIVEPILCFSMPLFKDTLEVFTVVQDESGAVFHLQLYMKYGGAEDQDAIANLEAFQIGARIIINRPCIRLDPDGGTSLVVQNADLGIYHLPSTSKQLEHEQQQGNGAPLKKCGYCGRIGETLQRCAKCQKVYYCDKECQKTDWNELKHKWICPFLV